MKLSILRRTEDYRVDHTADISIAYDPVAGETVEEMIQRVNGCSEFSLSSGVYKEVIEIRVVKQEPPKNGK